MSAESKLRPETQAVHAGQFNLDELKPVAAPLVLSSTYQRNEAGELPGDFIYSRHANPNRRALEECLAKLEGGGACAAFASGSAATMAVMQALQPGDHVLLCEDIYYGTRTLVHEIAAPWGMKSTEADTTNLSLVENSLLPNTRLIWIETPSNPLLRVTDIAGVVNLARQRDIRVVVDNTFATPLLQQPLALGADLVIHATSKYIAGHSDVIGGAVISRETNSAIFQRIRTIQTAGGAVPSPFDCWLALRGVRTLAVRLRAQCENARHIAEFLSGHARVHTVHYPGLSSHPTHHIAGRQMKNGGAMLSFQVHGGKHAALRIAGSTKLFKWATSLGGVESLIEHRASVEPGNRTPADLLRLSVGIEHVDDLISDLQGALAN